MPDLTTVAFLNSAAVVLAAVGAVLFGLAAVRQHGAVRDAVAPTRPHLRGHVRSALRLIRQPEWLIGGLQAGLGGTLHVVALALAPITLVQPIGVLAVPVTVMATSLRERRRPQRNQVLGSLLSVAGIAVLTVFLVGPSKSAGSVPDWFRLAITVAVVLAAGLGTILIGSRGRPRLRCVSLAATAAVLFGLNSVLVRTIGEIVATQTVSSEIPVLVTAVVGIIGALPLGIWAMQSAYVSGSPQVVICCLTLMDPLAAVVGGGLLLNDGAVLTGATSAGVLVCAALAAVGVLLLSAGHQAESTGPAATRRGRTVDPRVGGGRDSESSMRAVTSR